MIVYMGLRDSVVSGEAERYKRETRDALVCVSVRCAEGVSIGCECSVDVARSRQR